MELDSITFQTPVYLATSSICTASGWTLQVQVVTVVWPSLSTFILYTTISITLFKTHFKWNQCYIGKTHMVYSICYKIYNIYYVIYIYKNHT